MNYRFKSRQFIIFKNKKFYSRIELFISFFIYHVFQESLNFQTPFLVLFTAKVDVGRLASLGDSTLSKKLEL